MKPTDTPPIWNTNSYIRPIQSVAGGVRAFTHLAELRPPNEPPCRAYIKHFPPEHHRGLFNEWFGYTVMRSLGVPQPRAAMIQAPVMALPGTPLAWAFVSCQPVPVFEGTPAQIYQLSDARQHSALVARLFACPALPLLIAADQLIKNADRHLGNLVFTGKSSFVAIDHSDVLGGSAWKVGDLWATQTWAKSRLIEDVTRIKDLKPKTAQAIMAAAELISQAYFDAQRPLQDALGCGNNADVQTALTATWWRCIDLTQWFKDRLHLLT